MLNVLIIASNALYYLIWALEAVIFAYSILSIFDTENQSAILKVLGVVYYPVILPFRIILEKLGKSGGLFDYAPAFASLCLFAVSLSIPNINI